MVFGRTPTCSLNISIRCLPVQPTSSANSPILVRPRLTTSLCHAQATRAEGRGPIAARRAKNVSTALNRDCHSVSLRRESKNVASEGITERTSFTEWLSSYMGTPNTVKALRGLSFTSMQHTPAWRSTNVNESVKPATNCCGNPPKGAAKLRISVTSGPGSSIHRSGLPETSLNPT